MNPHVIVTCAITGAGDTVDKHPAIPVTPRQIAAACVEAANAGATVVHCHVRDPETGKGVVGRKAGSQPDFKEYTPAVTWRSAAARSR